MPEAILVLELQAMEAVDAGIVFAPAKTITELVKEATAAVGKVKEEDRQKTDSEDEADEESTPIPSSAAAAQLSKSSCCMQRVWWYVNPERIDGPERLWRARAASQGIRAVQTKMSDFAPKSTAPQIDLDMCD